MLVSCWLSLLACISICFSMHHAFSPAPPDMVSPGRRPNGHLRHPGLYQNMEMGMMQAPNPQAEKWYQQWVENGGQMPQPETKVDVPMQHAFAYGNCRMQNVNWNPQMEEFGLHPEMHGAAGGGWILRKLFK